MSMLIRATRALPPRVPQPPAPPSPPVPSTDRRDPRPAGAESPELPDPVPLGFPGAVIDLPPEPGHDLGSGEESTGQGPETGTGPWPTAHYPADAWLHVAMTVLSALAVLFGSAALWLEVS
ncbi:hypothetical protein [Streptomyces sp. B6B3]|uniref:hypothetical protein n=1 Tax=Streptomyces sp. B6B3 TaxID=3153570 RepID=UPI00325D4025